MAEDLEPVFKIQKYQNETTLFEMMDSKTLYRGLQIEANKLIEKGYHCIVEDGCDFATGDHYVMFLVQNTNKQTLHFRIRARSI
jgi:hypothetical protein